MHDTLRAKFRKFLDRMMQAARVLPMVGFGRSPEPPTEPVQREVQVGDAPPIGELHDQQHVDASSTAVDKRPRI
ncbi:MAG: hypothetical protein HOH95_12705 [Dehalococcoidia bacterium]|jgi:hypothetical protein|nr:hypothetical protein [Dehalococcoidia bacterium]